MREFWRTEITIRFPLLRELTWEEKVTDADLIREILKNEEVLDDIVTAAIEGFQNHYSQLRIHHWKLHTPLSILTNVDLNNLISILEQECTFLERRINWN
jgi:arginyl-tRNA synthetase